MRKSIAVALALLAWAFIAIQQAVARADVVTVSATVNGQDASAASASQPLRLQPGEPVDIAIEVTNHGSEAVDIRQVEFAGRVLGLNFFTYATSIDVAVAPGARDTVRYRLDLTGLKGQATGLIAGDLAIRGLSGAPIATVPTVTDVRGSLVSVYGLFGVTLVVLTALALLDAAVGLARHRLSANRWQRGLRLLTPGIGIGLVLAFSASVLRLWVPDTGQWLVVAGVTAAVFFALGYFSPTPDAEDDLPVDEDVEANGAADADTEVVPAEEVV